MQKYFCMGMGLVIRYEIGKSFRLYIVENKEP